MLSELKDILPITASTDSSGILQIGGCNVIELAQKFETPLIIYDEKTIVEKINEYKEAFKDADFKVTLAYASKAFNSLAICKIINEQGLSIDVASDGEMYTALKSGIDPKKMYFHGNNKSYKELAMAFENDIGRIVVDSFEELDKIGMLSKETGKKASILLRITPGIKAHTHSYLETGTTDCKFGFAIKGGLAIDAIKKALSMESVDLRGIHIHIGSQIFSVDSYVRAVKLATKFLAVIKKSLNWEAAELNIGGGIGIKYTLEDKPFSIKEFARNVITAVDYEFGSKGMKIPDVIIEPGRSIVCNAGVTVYTVGTIKDIPGIRTYVSVDGGMSDNLRPTLYGSKYEAMIANKANKKRNKTVAVAGKHCESGDILIKEALVQDISVGDNLIILATGAYCYSMANNYNKQTKPAVAMVKDGQSRLIIRRETLADLVSLDVE